jgi:hypothetical protein
MIMIKNLIKKMPFIYAVFLTVSCGDSVGDYMCFDDVRYIREFPQTFSLDSAVELDLDIIGMWSFRIEDSLLIVSTTNSNGLWSFFSLPEYKFLGKYLSRGQGPNEFIQDPSVGGAKFFKENGIRYAAIHDFQGGKLRKMNIDESIRTNRLNIYTLNDSLPPYIFEFITIDSTTFLCREINDSQTQQIRYISENGKKIIPPYMESLNMAAVRRGEDFNILSASIKQSIDNKLIVEMPIQLNYINLYSLDGSFCKTVCIGDKLDNIKKIQDKFKWNRKYTFDNLQLFTKCWGVLYINEDIRPYDMGRKKPPAVLLFDWSGEPLAELQLSNFATSFDIDFINGYLYALDLETDVFYRYDIKDIIEKTGCL